MTEIENYEYEQVDITEVLNTTYLTFITASDLYCKTELSCGIIKKTKKQNQIGYIITEDIECFDFVKNNNYTSHKIYADTYEEAFRGNKISSVVNAVIVIDDIASFILEIENLNTQGNFQAKLKETYELINDNNNYLIILLNSKVSIEQVEQVILQDTPNRPLFLTFKDYFDCTPTGNGISFPKFNFHPIKLNVNSEHYLFLEAKKNKNVSLLKFDCNQSGVWNDDIDELKYFNIVYPNEIRKLVEKDDNAKEDLPKIGNLLDIFGYKKFLANGEKIRKLVDNVLTYRNQRHLIFTKVDPNYGFNVIRDVLIDVLEPKDDPVEKVLAVNDFLNSEDKTSIVNKFNNKKYSSGEYQYKVLITNTYIYNQSMKEGDSPITHLKDIDHFHIIDTGLETAYHILYDLYKLYNYTNGVKDLNVHLYYNVTSDGKKNIEQCRFERYYKEKFYENVAFYFERCENGYKVEYESSGDRLQVSIPKTY